jgi:hypothetical protein
MKRLKRNNKKLQTVAIGRVQEDIAESVGEVASILGL